MLLYERRNFYYFINFSQIYKKKNIYIYIYICNYLFLLNKSRIGI